MKKLISVLLAALMLMSCFGMVSSAKGENCTCPVGVHVEGQACHCCVYCDTLDSSYVMNCYFKHGALCCDSCDGIYPCNCGASCGCEYCVPGNQDINAGDSTLGEYWTEQDQENFVDGFQAVLKKISDFFDMIFDAIFEFLRLEDILGAPAE